MAERTLVSINFPNFITIGLIAVGMLMLLAVIYQTAKAAMGSRNTEDASTGASY